MYLMMKDAALFVLFKTAVSCQNSMKIYHLKIWTLSTLQSYIPEMKCTVQMCLIVLLIKLHHYLFNISFHHHLTISRIWCQKIHNKMHWKSEWRIQDLQSSPPGLSLYKALTIKHLSHFLSTMDSWVVVNELSFRRYNTYIQGDYIFIAKYS